MKRIFVPTQSGTDWQRLLGKPELHWKVGRSAMAAAACWEDAHPKLPPEIQALLATAEDPAIADLDLLAAVPEWEVALPGGTTASHTDVLALTRNAAGLVVLGVEAKVDEPFGDSLKTTKTGASVGQLARIAYLEGQLDRTQPFPETIRYQLLHRTVSALLTAQAFHAPVAVMLVHSFNPKSAGRKDFDAFCRALACLPLSADMCEAPRTDGTRLLLGWCQGNPHYLTANLPAAPAIATPRK